MSDTIREARVRAFSIPTRNREESDGTARWDSTTMVVVQLKAGGEEGLGYTSASTAAAEIAARKIFPVIEGMNAFDISSLWEAMYAALRNEGQPGIASMAVAAVDTAAWDLKARLLGTPLARLFGMVRESMPVYGSGGFTSCTRDELQEQLGGWADQGMCWVKMKVGREPARDPERVRDARSAIGRETGLFVDANGAYDLRQALVLAEIFAGSGVIWFEEPVSSENRRGLAFLRRRMPACMEVTAGEYAFRLDDFKELLDGESVDVMQADATRCGGYTGFFKASALCEAFHIPLSAHTAPSLHLPAGLAVKHMRHLEYFFDHVRIESMIFDGVPALRKGRLYPDLSSPGNGLRLKDSDAGSFCVYDKMTAQDGSYSAR